MIFHVKTYRVTRQMGMRMGQKEQLLEAENQIERQVADVKRGLETL